MRSKTAYVVIVAAIAIGVTSLIFGSDFGGRRHGMGGTTPRSLWLGLIIVPLIAVISVLGYGVVFPEISEKKLEEKLPHMPADEKGEHTLDAVLRILKEDERKVIETIVSEGGTMLQKDIRWKTGFSRVKTHRILYRLAERGIVSAEKYHNTKKITLADWLLKE